MNVLKNLQHFVEDIIAEFVDKYSVHNVVTNKFLEKSLVVLVGFCEKIVGKSKDAFTKLLRIAINSLTGFYYFSHWIYKILFQKCLQVA